MAVVETKPRPSVSRDEAVFVAADGRRARRLRRAAVVVAVLAALWIVGLGIGVLGFGRLPGASLVKGAHHDSRPAQAPAAGARAGGDEAARSLLSANARSAQRDGAHSPAAVLSASRAATKHSTGAARRASRTHASAPAVTPRAPVNPAQRTRGWARKGLPAPQGQVRKANPPPPPPTSRGRRVGRTPPAAPPPVPPGQAKKAPEPPPPPPPPKKG
jgi:hypothetical protein